MFHIVYFALGVIFGVVLLQIYPKNGKTVTVYPSEDNKNHIQYVDKGQNCFSFEVTDVECPVNPMNTKVIPIQ
jgi:hypothetical protein